MLTKPTIVCLHGLGRSSSDWDAVRPMLEQLGHVVTPDLPKDTGEAFRVAVAATPNDAILVGHSYGAILAMRIAAERKSSLRAVVLTSSFFPPARNGRSLYASLIDYFEHRVAFIRELRSAKPSLKSGSKNTKGLGSLIKIAINQSAFNAVTKAITVPVLVIHARNDHYVPVDFVEAAAAKHPTWKLIILDKGGHYPHRDNTQDWLAVVTAWLAVLQTK